MLVCVKGEYSTAAVAGRPPGTVTRCQPSQIPSGSKRVHHLPQIQLLILIFKQRATRSQCANVLIYPVKANTFTQASSNPCWLWRPLLVS